MRPRRTEFLFFLLLILVAVWLIRGLLEDNQVFVCDLHGVDLRTTREEMEKDGALLFGYLDDGREIAVGRYGLERCRRW